jgi:hypothetical protein
MGAMHCMPAMQSADDAQGKEHFPACVLHLWVPQARSAVQGKPCGLGFIVPGVVAGGAAVGAGSS